MKKIVLLMTALLLVCGGASAQSNVLNRLKNRVKNAAEQNIGNKVEKGVNDVLDGKVIKNDKNNKQDEEQLRRENQERAEEIKRQRSAQDDGTWTCPECGHEGNTGKFCSECGAPRPAAKEAATWTCPECGHEGNTGKFCEECGAPKPDGVKDATTQNVKSDFKRGEVILFEDDFADEQIGEFPSKWDVVRDGNAETAVLNGTKYLYFATDYNQVQPLMENMDAYLPDVFTLEWDVYCAKQGDFGQSSIELNLFNGDDRVGEFELTFRPWNPDYYGSYFFKKGNTIGQLEGSFGWDALEEIIKIGQWNHFAVSFNKRALKGYINGVRVINLPNVAAPGRFEFFCNGDYKYRGIAHVVLAAGAVDLYERKTTDLSAVEKAIAETGKFVTNNILFETGKATLKPESMEEIQKVADYMKKNPSARFEVQGHTDNQGSDKINDPLSQQRAEAVVKALEGLGVDGFNLRAVGKGAHEPIADNATDEGRAKNRRVEFVKK